MSWIISGLEITVLHYYRKPGTVRTVLLKCNAYESPGDPIRRQAVIQGFQGEPEILHL